MNTHTHPSYHAMDPLTLMGALDLRTPYGLSVLIKGTPDQHFAEECAPLVARIEYPQRLIGEVICTIRLGVRTFEVIVTDLGPTKT